VEAELKRGRGRRREKKRARADIEGYPIRCALKLTRFLVAERQSADGFTVVIFERVPGRWHTGLSVSEGGPKTLHRGTHIKPLGAFKIVSRSQIV